MKKSFRKAGKVSKNQIGLSEIQGKFQKINNKFPKFHKSFRNQKMVENIKKIFRKSVKNQKGFQKTK
jgi:hypothetical protein